MKKGYAFVILLAACLCFCACGTTTTSSDSAEAKEAQPVSSGSVFEKTDIRMYEPGITVETSFGEITVLDAAFCGKAQLIEALPRPAYNAAGDGRIVFSMRTRISNTSGKDLVLLDDLKVSVRYGNEDSYGCSKGGKYQSSDPLYTVLPSSASGEYIICGRIPVAVYEKNEQFTVSFNDAKLRFQHDAVQIYNSMGYQDGDNLLTSMENLIISAGTAPEKTEQKVTANTETTAELAFALEDTRYEITKNYLAVEVKIRNNSNVFLEWPTFLGVILDANGDILENCSCSYTNGLEAGQAGWSAIRISEATTLEAMDSVKLVTMWYKEKPESTTHNLRFDLPEPFVIRIRDLKQK